MHYINHVSYLLRLSMFYTVNVFLEYCRYTREYQPETVSVGTANSFFALKVVLRDTGRALTAANDAKTEG